MAQTPYSLANQYTQRVWTKEHGLPGNWVQTIHQTSDGYLWLGTRSGLVRFDGVRFTEITPDEKPGNISLFCRDMTKDSEGNLWAAAKHGLFSYRSGVFKSFSNQDELGGKETRAVIPRSAGGIWVGTENGLGAIWTGMVTNYINSFVEYNTVYSLDEDQIGNVWVGFQDGLYKFDPKTVHFSRLWGKPQPLQQSAFGIVHCIQVGQRDNVWFGTAEGLFCLKEGRITEYSDAKGIPRSLVSSIYKDRRGHIWVVADGKVYVSTDNESFDLAAPHLLSENEANCVFEDSEENLWVGTRYNGLHRLRSSAVKTFTSKDGLSNDNINSITKGQDGRLWIATGSGVTTWRDGQFSQLNLDSDSSKISFRSILEEPDGDLWLGTTGKGVRRFRMEGNEYKRVPIIESDYRTWTIFRRQNGEIWITGKIAVSRHIPKEWTYRPSGRPSQRFDYGLGWIYRAEETVKTRGLWLWYDTPSDDRLNSQLWALDPEGLQNETPKGTLASYDVRAIYEDQEGILWLGTVGGGLNRFRDGKFTSLTVEDGLASNDIWSIHEDDEGVLWIGTSKGLSRIENGNIRSFTTDHGLHDNEIKSLIEDHFGNFWIGCEQGIFRVSRRSLNAVHEETANSVSCLAFNESDGLITSEINGEFQPSACKSNDGTLWFPTTRGLVVIDPSSIRANDRSPPVVIEEIRANDAIVYKDGRALMKSENGQRDIGDRKQDGEETGKVPVLPPDGAKVIEIHYTANSYVAPEKVRFNYRLIGHDSNWTDARTRRVAYYTNLKPGEYRFQVIAANNHNVWNEKGASFVFYVAPHFYEKPVFYGISVATVFGLAYGFYRWRAGELDKMHRLMAETKLARERTRIARDIHDDLGAGLTQIGLLSELANRTLNKSAPAERHVQKIALAVGEISQSVDEIVWAVNPGNDSLKSLLSYLREYVSELMQNAGLKSNPVCPESIPDIRISAQTRHHLFLVVKEALHNVIQHANAKEVSVKIELHKPVLSVTIMDDGQGFKLDETERTSKGNGLGNMQKRIQDLDGRFVLTTQPGFGTEVSIKLNLGNEKEIHIRSVKS